MQDWKSEAVHLKLNDGMSWTQLYTYMQSKYFPDMDPGRIQNMVRGAVRRAEQYRAEREETPEPKPEKPPKIEVIQNFIPAEHDAAWKGSKAVRFALMGDTQINSKYTQITHLHAFYDECARQGIKHVYHTGDMDEGEQMRPGHQYECYTQGADDHVAEIVRVYPRKAGMTTHFITGNHDASTQKRCGYNIGPAIAAKRSDMHYLGQDCAVINLTPNCSLELRHPWDGTAYALSYKIQKMVDAMSGGEKPNILAVGHYHKSEFLFYRNVHCFQTGTFQAQTPFMRGKGISAHMGGWIVEAHVNDEGTIERIRQELIPFYKAIPEDYKNWA